jgi:hypothetical protein
VLGQCLCAEGRSGVYVQQHGRMDCLWRCTRQQGGIKASKTRARVAKTGVVDAEAVVVKQICDLFTAQAEAATASLVRAKPKLRAARPPTGAAVEKSGSISCESCHKIQSLVSQITTSLPTMALCAKCQKPLTIDIEPDDDDDNENDGDVEMDPAPTETVPDDVRLPCGDHFHWECLLDSYEYTQCPHCSRSIITSPPGGSSAGSQEQIIVNLNNEGGLQEGIDIMPILKEESYLRAYPEERKCRAFLEFCREGDHKAIAELIKSCSEEPEEDEEDEGPQKSADEILRYQDPINGQQSGLHAAAANGHREVAWLLLLLASNYPELEFPALVFQEAAALGVMREEQEGKVDIRSLRDAEGRTAEDVAKEAGVIWNGWIGNGRLAI